jgi:hypothetical protein
MPIKPMAQPAASPASGLMPAAGMTMCPMMVAVNAQLLKRVRL